MKILSSSNEKFYLQKNRYIKRKIKEDKDMVDENTKAMLDSFETFEKSILQREQDPKFKENNLEYDLRSTDWILDKVRKSDVYAQNLYAAICNNEFIKNDVWPIISDNRWSASWRYAGGIIADMRQEGDYLNWYCSGIKNKLSDEEFNSLDKEHQEKYLQMKNNFVNESIVTEEIKEDLFKLGWLVVEDLDDK